MYTQKQTVLDTLEGKLGVIKCDSGNVEVQWNNIKECVLDTLSDLVGKVQKRARKPWITQEMISKMDERRKWKNVNIEEGRKNYRRLRNELKRATDNAKKEYLKNIHSFSSLSYDRSKASSKASSPHSAIQSFRFQMRVSSPFLKVIQ